MNVRTVHVNSMTGAVAYNKRGGFFASKMWSLLQSVVAEYGF